MKKRVKKVGRWKISHMKPYLLLSFRKLLWCIFCAIYDKNREETPTHPANAKQVIST